MIVYNDAIDINREKRRELKQKYDDLRLPKKVLLNGYIFSLHDILEKKLVFLCQRNMSMDCDVRIHITWEQLEKAPNRVVQTTKDILDISGVLFYNIKGEHTEACRLRNAFNSNLTHNTNNHLWVEQIETKKSLDTELDDLFKDSSHFTVDRKNTITMDLKMAFFHKKFSLYLDNNVRSEVFFFGSEDMLTILRNVEDIYIDFTLINFKGNTDLFILTLLAADDNRCCLPCMHIVFNTRNKKLFRIIFSELRDILGHEELKWKRCYSFHDKIMMHEFKTIFKLDLRYNHFEFIKELETETRKINMANDEIQKIIISMCESLWMMDHGQRQASIDKLVQELKDNQEGYPYSKLFQFFMNKLRIHGIKENENSLKCHYVWSNQSCETFHIFLKEKFRRKKMSINNVASELRKLEYETRSNFLKGIYKYKNIAVPEHLSDIKGKHRKEVTEIEICEI